MVRGGGFDGGCGGGGGGGVQKSRRGGLEGTHYHFIIARGSKSGESWPRMPVCQSASQDPRYLANVKVAEVVAKIIETIDTLTR